MDTRLLSLLLAAAAASACVETTAVTPDANTLVIHAVLDPGVQHQLIIVQTTTGAVQAQRELQRAVVTIATPDGRTLTAVERHDTAAVNRVVLFPKVNTIYDVDVGGTGLIPGGTYQTSRRGAGWSHGHGADDHSERCSVDDHRADADPSIGTANTVSLRWSRVAGARGYQVFVSSIAGTYGVFADTSVVLPGTTKVLENNEDVLKPGYAPARGDRGG